MAGRSDVIRDTQMREGPALLGAGRRPAQPNGKAKAERAEPTPNTGWPRRGSGVFCSSSGSYHDAPLFDLRSRRCSLRHLLKSHSCQLDRYREQTPNLAARRRGKRETPMRTSTGITGCAELAVG